MSAKTALFCIAALCGVCHALLPDEVDKSRWMTELNSVIGDSRIGDLIIPGCHDAGTAGINEDSFLVDRNFLFQLGDLVTPQTLVNWSLTQEEDLDVQMLAGYRQFDLRIADVEIYDGTFRWWHGLTGDIIQDGLQKIYDFAVSNPMEIILMEFTAFAAPGISGTIPIRNARKDEIAEILLDYMSPVLVPESSVSENPTVNEILATGRNVIIHMGDSYIESKDDLFWPRNLHGPFSGRTNPEDLFAERSSKMADIKINHPDRLTLLTGCATPTEVTIAGAMIRVYWDNPIIKDILERLLPGVAELEADLMSFEGVFTSLLEQARYGTNTGGMHTRRPDLYTNGASVNYVGMNDQWGYLFARPHIYKANIIAVDDFSSSTIVDWAIRANMGAITRQASVSFQGSCRDGFYEWVNFQAVGGEEGLSCGDIDVQFSVRSSQGELLQKHFGAGEKWMVIFEEGEYPTSAEVVIEVSLPQIGWYELSSTNIQGLIDEGKDLFVRGNERSPSGGLIYTSNQYNLFGADCDTRPDDSTDYIDMLVW